MNGLRFFQKNIKICALVIGCVIGIIMFHCYCTDFSYVENYFKYTLFNENVYDVELDKLIFFIMYYELKKIIVINIICITKYRKYFVPIFFLVCGVTLSVQVCLISKAFKIVVISSVIINIIEKVAQMIYISMAEKYILKSEEMVDDNFKYKLSVFINLLFINVIIVGGISIFFAIILKYFLF